MTKDLIVYIGHLKLIRAPKGGVLKIRRENTDVLTVEERSGYFIIEPASTLTLADTSYAILDASGRVVLTGAVRPIRWTPSTQPSEPTPSTPPPPPTEAGMLRKTVSSELTVDSPVVVVVYAVTLNDYSTIKVFADNERIAEYRQRPGTYALNPAGIGVARTVIRVEGPGTAEIGIIKLREGYV